jgi:hypothetical protein
MNGSIVCINNSYHYKWAVPHRKCATLHKLRRATSAAVLSQTIRSSEEGVGWAISGVHLSDIWHSAWADHVYTEPLHVHVRSRVHAEFHTSIRSSTRAFWQPSLGVAHMVLCVQATLFHAGIFKSPVGAHLLRLGASTFAGETPQWCTLRSTRACALSSTRAH